METQESIALIGIVRDQTATPPISTAVMTGRGAALYFGAPGDEIAGTYRVERVEDDRATLTEIQTGRAFVLVLR